MASTGFFRKAACGFDFPFCQVRHITAVSGQATCTEVMRSVNSPWHRRLFLRIYIKFVGGEVGKHIRNEDKLLDFAKVL